MKYRSLLSFFPVILPNRFPSNYLWNFGLKKNLGVLRPLDKTEFVNIFLEKKIGKNEQNSVIVRKKKYFLWVLLHLPDFRVLFSDTLRSASAYVERRWLKLRFEFFPSSSSRYVIVNCKKCLFCCTKKDHPICVSRKINYLRFPTKTKCIFKIKNDRPRPRRKCLAILKCVNNRKISGTQWTGN